jgi:hypothetical protein
MPADETERWAISSRDTSQTRTACDSLVALSDATADGSVPFAKNSDRRERIAKVGIVENRKGKSEDAGTQTRIWVP